MFHTHRPIPTYTHTQLQPPTHASTHWKPCFKQSVAVRVYSGEILEPLQPSRHAVIRDTELMGNQSAQVEWPGLWWREESCLFQMYTLMTAAHCSNHWTTTGMHLIYLPVYLSIYLSSLVVRIHIKVNLNCRSHAYTRLVVMLRVTVLSSLMMVGCKVSDWRFWLVKFIQLNFIVAELHFAPLRSKTSAHCQDKKKKKKASDRAQ